MIRFELLMQPLWQNLVFALLHTLWQAAVLALLVYGVLRWLPVRRPKARYGVTLAAQCGVLLAGFVTWAILDGVRGLPSPDRRPLVARTSPSLAELGDALPTAAVAERQRSARVPAAGSIPTAGPTFASEPSRWVAWAAGAWLLGVSMMLLRNVMSVGRAQRLARGPRMRDATILAAVDQLRRELRIGRRVRVVWCDLANSPAVLGIIWPTLVLPVSLLTGLSPESLRAILAHELAHVRRHDYLVNLLQLAIESLLFFNPAVWWIGRQVRCEREACCDAMAVAITGEPLTYAETLAEWLRHQSFHAAAVSWTGRGGRRLILDRVRRLLWPGYRPDVPLSWSGLVGLLVIAPLMLAGLWQGTTAVVAAAADILSPAERIEKMRQIAETHSTPRRTAADAEPQATFTVSGRVRMEDGTPLPPRVDVRAQVTTRVGSSVGRNEKGDGGNLGSIQRNYPRRMGRALAKIA